MHLKKKNNIFKEHWSFDTVENKFYYIEFILIVVDICIKTSLRTFLKQLFG